MQAIRPPASDYAMQPLSQDVRSSRPLEQTFNESAKVETRPTGDDGQTSPLRDETECPTPEALIVTRGEILAGVPQIHHVVRDGGLLCRRWFGRPHIHVAVHLEGVAADDLALEL